MLTWRGDAEFLARVGDGVLGSEAQRLLHGNPALDGALLGVEVADASRYGTLAIGDAGDCCVYWWYHVAPLVTVKTDLGPIKYVIDPSMFDEPVSIAVWTAAQENHGCAASANFGYYEITPGKIYTPGGGTDNSYSSTNWTCNW